jgi:methionyl-tRNA formyltransferase
MDEGYDSGPIIASEAYKFAKNASYQDIRTDVYRRGCALAGKAVAMIQKQRLTPGDCAKQDESKAHYWRPIPESEMKVVLERVAERRFKYQCA